MQQCKNCSRVCAYHCAQLSYTTQHRAIIFPLILQTSTKAQILSIGGEGGAWHATSEAEFHHSHIGADRRVVLPLCLPGCTRFVQTAACQLETPSTVPSVVFDSGPFAPLCQNMTSSAKPEVHNTSHGCQRRTDPRPRVTIQFDS